MSLSPPSSQKAGDRPISFVLDDQTALGGSPVSLDLVIRPEDLTRTDPSRINVQQTLGGAWADSFGPGVPMININGHTGWRRTDGDSNDGQERFVALKEQVFDNWHASRKAAVQAGQDPNGVQLVFSDALDGFAVVVAPMNFALRRSRSRPLLLQYSIQMAVLDQNVDQLGYLQFGGGFLDADVTQSLGLDSLTASINEITGYINQVHTFVDRTLVAPVKAFMNQTARLYNAVTGAVSAASNTVGSLISVATLSARAGMNLFRTMATVASLPTFARSMLMQVAGSYSNAFCVLRNALHQRLTYPDYSSLYGSSNCSSTSGGRPISMLAGVNPFYQIVPSTGALPVTLSTSGNTAMATLANSDPVLAPMTTSDLSSALRDVNSGLAVLA